MTDTGARDDLADAALASVLLPAAVHEGSAAILVVDVRQQAVTYVNELARQLAPDAQLPIAVDRWSELAGLTDLAGDDLPTGAASRSQSESLLRVAQGEPVLGEAVAAARATAVTSAHEPLWVVGIPMTDAPPPLAALALVALLPLRNAQLVSGTQQAVTLLRDRAVVATKVAFTITDPSQPDNPLLWVNPAFSTTTGYSFEDAVGRNCRFLQGPGTDRGVLDEIRRSLDAEQPITTTLLNYRKDGSPFWNELSISPIRDANDVVTHFVGVQADVTARIQAQRARDDALHRAEVAAGRLALLADFATRLTGSLENADIVELLADVLVPQLGTWCALHLLENSETGTRSIVRHENEADPRVAELVRRMHASLAAGLTPDSPTAAVLRGERPHVFVPDVAANRPAAGARDDERSAIAAELGVDGVIVVPLRSRTRVLGCVAIMAGPDRRPFDRADLTLAGELAARTALMLENSNLYTRERTAAVTLQRSMMPVVPQLRGLTMAARYLTATDEAAVGGDWYDVFVLRGGGVGIAVGDAMGHNLDSAAAMGKLSTMLRAYAWPGAGAGEVLDAVDSLLSGTHLGYLATCCYGRLKRTDEGARFEYANAGHPPPLLRLPDGSAQPLDGGRSAMLGVGPLVVDGPAARGAATVDVPHGSMLIFYTDGLTDSLGDLDLTAALEELARIVAEQPADLSPRRMVAALAERAQGGRTDDVVIVVVRID